MKLVMTLLVRDEADVLRANLEHHFNEGVDHVILTDNLSADETRDIAVEYERAGTLTLIDERADNYDQSAWVTRMARIGARDLGADWIINNDADEFWFAPDGSLAAHLSEQPASVSVLEAVRYDLLPMDEGGARDLVYRYAAPRRFDGTALPSKVCHRASPHVIVGQGNHAVRTARFRRDLGSPVRTGLHILHAPMRSREQMRRKVVLGGAAYERNTKVADHVGHQWRALAAREAEGEFDAWWAEQAVTPADLGPLLERGEVVTDPRFVDLLERYG